MWGDADKSVSVYAEWGFSIGILAQLGAYVRL
jgi:hypothetical protein